MEGGDVVEATEEIQTSISIGGGIEDANNFTPRIQVQPAVDWKEYFKEPDVEKDIKEYELINKQITRNRIMIDVFGNLTTFGQVGKLVETAFIEIGLNTGLLTQPDEKTKITLMVQDMLLGGGVVATTAEPKLRAVASLISTGLKIENMRLGIKSSFIIEPRIRKYRPSYFDTSSRLGGGGASGSW